MYNRTYKMTKLKDIPKPICYDFCKIQKILACERKTTHERLRKCDKFYLFPPVENPVENL